MPTPPPPPQTLAQRLAKVTRRSALSLGYNKSINDATDWRKVPSGLGALNNVEAFTAAMSKHLANQDPLTSTPTPVDHVPFGGVTRGDS